MRYIIKGKLTRRSSNEYRKDPKKTLKDDARHPRFLIIFALLRDLQTVAKQRSRRSVPDSGRRRDALLLLAPSSNDHDIPPKTLNISNTSKRK
jgi:hypothetical protein